MKRRGIRSADDLARFLSTYPQEVVFGDGSPGTVYDRYHSPDCVLVNDGAELDRQQIVEHAATSPRRLNAVSVEVRDALVTGDRVAGRYLLKADMRKGQRVDIEVFMFGRLAADGRLRHVDQLTRTVTPAT